MPAATPSLLSIDRSRFAVMTAGFCAFLGLYAPQSLLPDLARQFQASEAQVGLTVSASTMAVALMAPFVGVAVALLGRKRTICLAALLAVPPVLLAGAAGSLHELIFWRFFQGLFLPCIFAVTIAHISEEWPPEETADVTGLYVACTILGGFCGRFLTSVVTDHFGWRAAFMALGALGLLCTVVMVAWLPRDSRVSAARPASQSRTASLLKLFGNSQLMATCGIGFAILFSLVGLFTYMGFHLSAPPFSLRPSVLGSLFSVYLLGVVVTPMSGKIIRRLGRRQTMAAAVGVACLGLVLAAFPSVPMVMAGLGLASTGVFVIQAAATGFIGLSVPVNRPTAIGMYFCCYYVGGSAGAVLPAYAWTAYGWLGCLALVGAMLLAALTLAMVFWRDRPQAVARAVRPEAA